MGEANSNIPGLSRRRLLSGICAAALTVSIGATTLGGAQAATAGGSFVVRAGQDLINAAKSGSPSAFRSLLRSYLDVTTMALFALGKHRRKLPEDQQSEYVALVEGYMVHTLSQFGRKFKGRKFEVVNSRKSGRGVTVESKLKFLGGKQQKVTWKLAGTEGALPGLRHQLPGCLARRPVEVHVRQPDPEARQQRRGPDELSALVHPREREGQVRLQGLIRRLAVHDCSPVT